MQVSARGWTARRAGWLRLDRQVALCLRRTWQEPPHPPAGRSGVCALRVLDPSAGEGPARPSADGLESTPVRSTLSPKRWKAKGAEPGHGCCPNLGGGRHLGGSSAGWKPALRPKLGRYPARRNFAICLLLFELFLVLDSWLGPTRAPPHGGALPLPPPGTEHLRRCWWRDRRGAPGRGQRTSG
jgi:hypothetical protein